MTAEPGLLYADGYDRAHPYPVADLCGLQRRLPADLYPLWHARHPALDLRALTSCAAHGGIDAELHVWEGAPHSAFFMTGAPEQAEHHAERARFLAKHVGGGL